MFDPLSYFPPGTEIRPRGRRIGADGMVTIICRICEKPICREPYRKFSTAICAVCHGELEQGKRPEDIISAYREQNKQMEVQVKEDVGPGGFKALGIGKRLREVVADVRKAIGQRKPPPIFSQRDQIVRKK